MDTFTCIPVSHILRKEGQSEAGDINNWVSIKHQTLQKFFCPRGLRRYSKIVWWDSITIFLQIRNQSNREVKSHANQHTANNIPNEIKKLSVLDSKTHALSTIHVTKSCPSWLQLQGCRTTPSSSYRSRVKKGVDNGRCAQSTQQLC